MREHVQVGDGGVVDEAHKQRLGEVGLQQLLFLVNAKGAESIAKDIAAHSDSRVPQAHQLPMHHSRDQNTLLQSSDRNLCFV